jgi:hypothetical protein
MKRFAIYLFLFLSLTGCASAKWLPDFNLFKHEQKGDVQAVKTGDIAPIKAPISADGKLSVVDNSKKEDTKNTAGGSIITQATSDPTVIMSIASGLFGFMGTLIIQMFFTIRAKDKQIGKLMEGQQKFITQQEEGQQKYIAMLERIAMSVIEDKIKKEAV